MAAAAAKLMRKPGIARRLSLKPVLEDEPPRADGGRRMTLAGLGMVIVTARRTVTHKPSLQDLGHIAEEDSTPPSPSAGASDRSSKKTKNKFDRRESTKSSGMNEQDEQERLLEKAAEQEDLHVIIVTRKSKVVPTSAFSSASVAISPERNPAPTEFGFDKTVLSYEDENGCKVSSSSPSQKGALKRQITFPDLIQSGGRNLRKLAAKGQPILVGWAGGGVNGVPNGSVAGGGGVSNNNKQFRQHFHNHHIPWDDMEETAV